ncbi:MAG: ACP S-malonyltransferase, partial [Cyclobacteriaceae bacterium]
MKKAYIFPGQGSQYQGMGKSLYEENARAKELFDQADQILGFSLTEVMFTGSDEDLKQTNVTQPAIFLHSVAIAETTEDFNPDMVAGHSLGEISALVAARSLSFEDGLRLVSQRANAMQKACEANPSTMAAILALTDDQVKEICAGIDDTVVAANFNSPGQVVISGTHRG